MSETQKVIEKLVVDVKKAFEVMGEDIRKLNNKINQLEAEHDKRLKSVEGMMDYIRKEVDNESSRPDGAVIDDPEQDEPEVFSFYDPKVVDDIKKFEEEKRGKK